MTQGPSVIMGYPEQMLVEKWGTWVLGTWSGVAEERVGGGDQKGDKDQRVKGQRVRQWGRRTHTLQTSRNARGATGGGFALAVSLAYP